MYVVVYKYGRYRGVRLVPRTFYEAGSKINYNTCVFKENRRLKWERGHFLPVQWRKERAIKNWKRAGKEKINRLRLVLYVADRKRK